MHVRVAEALAHCHASHLDGVSAQIALHFDQGGRPEQAVHFYELAAHVAHKVFANAEAISHLKRAKVLLEAQIELGSAPAREQAARIGEALGDLLFISTQYADAQDAFEWALARAGSLLARARLQRKIGNMLRDTRHYDEALTAYARASAMLGVAEGPHAPVWWHEWIQIQLETDLVYYWLGDVEANASLLNHLQPVLLQHGTATQRASFHQNMTYRRFSANRGVATEDMVEGAKQALAAFIEAGDASRLPSATFGMGFVLLWHGKPGEAESPMLEALHMAEQTGDTSLVARCITYLGFVARQTGRVEETAQYVARGLAAAETAGMPEYTALAHANASWVAWRKGDWAGAREQSRAALDIWSRFSTGHAEHDCALDGAAAADFDEHAGKRHRRRCNARPDTA